MVQDGLLSGEKVQRRWRVRTADVKRLRDFRDAKEPEQQSPSPVNNADPDTRDADEIDPGMVEVGIALAGVAIAIATFLPGVTTISQNFRILIAILSGLLAVFSTYGALALLAYYCVGFKSSSAIEEIKALLLRQSNKARIYWFMAAALLFGWLLSVLVGILAITR